MAHAFAELGLSAELVTAAGSVGYEDPTGVQRAAIPVIRRGGNAVVRASSGAGVTAAYGLGVLDRLLTVPHEAEQTRALIVTPSAERASEVASALSQLARGTGLRVRAMVSGWRGGPADILVTPPDTALRALGTSTLKLDALQALVIDGAAAVFALSGTETLEMLMVSVPGDAQRVVTTASTTADVERFVQSHARRAIEIPSRPADRAATVAPSARGGLGYDVVAEHEKEQALAELLTRAEGESVVIARTEARAAKLRDALAARGFQVTDRPGGDDVVAVLGALDAPRATVAYDVPADAPVLERMVPRTGVVLVTAAELPHLRSLAAETGFTLGAVPRRVGRGELAEFRERLRRAIEEEDLDAQLLVLGPLLDEFTASEVAAALSALLRARDRVEDTPSSRPAATSEASTPPAPFVRLFVSIGQRDGIRPADIVGAFTGEAGIRGDQIGRIDLRDTFSVVEVDSTTADRVISALNGTTVRGRSLRVDYDRRTTTTPRKTKPTRTSR